MSNILEPNFNGLPKPTDWKKVIVPLQQANEKEFRGATLLELGDNLNIEMSINAQRVPAVPPGPLVAGPADREVFMEIKVPGSWTWGTNPPLTNAQGNISTFYWDKTDWKKNDGVALPVIPVTPTIALNNHSAAESEGVYKAIINRSATNFNTTISTDIGYALNAITFFNGEVYQSLKADNKDAISVASSWKNLGLKPDGAISLGVEKSVSGDAVRKAIQITDAEVAKNKGNYFSESGYAHGTLGTIIPSDTYMNTGLLPIGKAKQIKIRGSNSTSASVLNFYDKEFKFISRAIPSSDSSSNKEWTISAFPEHTFFVIGSSQIVNTNSFIDFDSIANVGANVVKTYQDFQNINTRLQYKSQIKCVDFKNVQEGFVKVNGLEVYKTKYTTKNTKLRVAFKFRFNRDINIGDDQVKLPILTVKGKHSSQGDIYFQAHVRSQKTERLITNENRYTEPGKTILTTYPLPKYNTGFGWVTDNQNTPSDKLNFEYPNRNLPEMKALVGRDALRIQYKGLLKNNPSKSVDDVDVQQHLDLNRDWKITIDNSAVIIFNGSVSESFSYSTYPTLAELYNAIKAKTLSGQTLELFEVESFDTGSSTNLNYGPAYPSNSLLRVENIPFISIYPAMVYNVQDATTTRLDAFSFYGQFGHDRSEHTLEFVMDLLQGGGLLNIDGQFVRYASGEGQFNGAANIPNITRLLDAGYADIIIGGNDSSTEAIITPYDVLIETEQFTECEFSMTNGRIASWYTPLIIGSGGHAMYKGENIGQTPSGYDDGTPPPNTINHVVPAKYKRPRTGYEGDDYVSINALTSATQNYVRFINELKSRGYANVTLNEVSEWFNGNGKLPHYKCYFIQLDDYRTYAFSDIDMRREFTKTATKISFCLELAKYVDDKYTPNTGGKSGQEWMTLQADTNDHRLALQKRLQHMQMMKWECTMHGENGNTYTAMTSKELNRVVKESTRMSDYLGVYSNIMTWAASQYTVNSVKTFEHNGLSFILRSGGEYSAKCDNKFCVSRLYFDQLNWQNLLTKII